MKHIKVFEDFRKKKVYPTHSVKDDTFYILPSYVNTFDDFGEEIKLEPGAIIHVDGQDIGRVHFSYEGKKFSVPSSDFKEFFDHDVDVDLCSSIQSEDFRLRLREVGVKDFGEISPEEVEKRRGRNAGKKYGF